MTKQIYITSQDSERLEALLDHARDKVEGVYPDGLEVELGRALVVDPQEIPSHVITMNSTVVLVDIATGTEETYTLVYPQNANTESGMVSVLAPLGTAMLGYRVGDVFEWEVPQGVKSWRVARVIYQPEAAGDLDR